MDHRKLLEDGDRFLKDGKFAEARAIFSTLAVNSPMQALAWQRLGELSLRDKDWEGAERWLSRAVSAAPRDGLAHFQRGLAAYWRRDLSAAIRARSWTSRRIQAVCRGPRG